MTIFLFFWQGAAVEDGRLKCGDRLLSINGVDLTGKTKDDAVAELRNVPMGRKVKIVVSRQEDVHSRTEVRCGKMHFQILILYRVHAMWFLIRVTIMFDICVFAERKRKYGSSGRWWWWCRQLYLQCTCEERSKWPEYARNRRCRF